MHGEGVRVLIVGAGIAGLAAARALGAWGAAVEVVERAPGPATAGTGIYLPGNAVRALDALGLAEAVTGRAVRIERQHTADHRGRALFDVDVARWWSGVGPCVALHRADLQQALLTGIGDVPISWGQTIREAAADHGGVRIELSSGRTVRYDLVLGADGVHSTVRQLMVDAPSVRPVGQRAWRFVAPCSEQAPVWSVQLGRGSAFLTIPIGDGQLCGPGLRVRHAAQVPLPRARPRRCLAVHTPKISWSCHTERRMAARSPSGECHAGPSEGLLQGRDTDLVPRVVNSLVLVRCSCG